MGELAYLDRNHPRVYILIRAICLKMLEVVEKAMQLKRLRLSVL